MKFEQKLEGYLTKFDYKIEDDNTLSITITTLRAPIVTHSFNFTIENAKKFVSGFAFLIEKAEEAQK